MDERNDMDMAMVVIKWIVIMCFSLLTTFPQSHCEPPTSNYSVCKEQSYNCGNLSNIPYPFWGHFQPPECRGGDPFELQCHDNVYATPPTTTIVIDSQNLEVIDIDTTSYTIRMKRTENDVCSPAFGNTINMSLTPFKYLPSVQFITIFYNCSHPYIFSCEEYGNGGNVTYYRGEEDKVLIKHPDLWNCDRRVQVQAIEAPPDPNEEGAYLLDLENLLQEGFDVYYNVSQECINCLKSEGVCGTDAQQKFSCYCPDGSSSPQCPHHKNTLDLRRKIIIAVGCTVFGGLLVLIVVYLWWRRKNSYKGMSYIQSQSLSSDPSLKDTEKGSRFFVIPGVHLFTYNELEEATNYFDSSRELGEGGFGTVYFGKLRDGRCVAVKRLYENNYRRVEQFMNEIEILAKVIHPNLVSLYGCTSRHSRELLLVYEYIPNGTVADHLHGGRAKPGTFPWHIRMSIAVETASALKYLHLTEIIHRDVKTNNILLDKDFHVKVADFGLSRLFPDAVTHISTAPQGTPGYVDPEYHECYQLTTKSDVYSFGVVLIELISSLPAVDITRHRHEINLANMAINKIHNQALHELVDPTLGFESDLKVKKMINAVAELAFRCLQSSKDERPSMGEVLDTLKDIQSDGKHKSQPEVMDISSSADDVVLLKDDPPPPSPDSNAVSSKSTTPNASG